MEASFDQMPENSKSRKLPDETESVCLPKKKHRANKKEAGSSLLSQNGFGENLSSNFNEQDVHLGSEGEHQTRASSTDGQSLYCQEESGVNNSSSHHHDETGPSVEEGNDNFLESKNNEDGYTCFSEVLRELGQESKMVMLQYSQTFGDSEAFEQQACQNFVDLKGHAELLEHNINEKKKEFHAHLREIMKVLSVPKDGYASH